MSDNRTPSIDGTPLTGGIASPLRILLVEDSEHDRLAFCRALTKSQVPVEITTYERAEKALERLNVDIASFDLIITDHKLPGMSGLELCQELIKQECPLPLVMLTGAGAEYLAVEALKAGVDDYIIKDHDRGYLKLLPVVLPNIVRKHSDRLARKRAEKALRESEERFRAITENTTDVTVILDREGMYQYVSPSINKVLEYSPKEILGKTLDRFIHADDMPTINDAIARAIREPGTTTHVPEFRMGRRDGRWLYLEGLFTSLLDLPGVNGVVFNCRNITERKRAEEAMLQASRLEATATLAGGIAHDLNNLMVSVLGYAELLKLDLADRDDAADWDDSMDMLDTISKSARQASELAQQMLAFARGGKYQPRVMNLKDTVQRVLYAQKRSLPSRIHVELDTAPDLWNVKADPTQMSQVVLNLFTNAVEAIEGRGHITVTTGNIVLDEGFAADLRPGPFVYLSVQDTGCGMSDEVRSRIFEPFFTTKLQGRGMGLAAVYGIVENHGGHISIHSEKGRGTTFQVYIPAIEAKERQKPPSVTFTTAETAVSAEVVTRTRTILVVEDDESVLSVTQRILDRLGYQSLIAHNGQEAVDVALTFEGEIDLALLDMGMPVMGGAEAYPLLMEARPKMKVIICSGYELDATAQTLLDAGANAFVRKPFQMCVLGAEIRKVLHD